MIGGRLLPRETREMLIGALAFVVLVVVLGISYGAEPRTDASEADAIRLTAHFNRIDGLALGDPVYVSGVKVGSVAALQLTDDYRVAATFRVDRSVELRADTAAAVHTDGLFGSKFVILDPGGDDRILGDGDVIRYTQDAVVVSRMLDLIISRGHAARSSAAAED